jgi:hypothetical protein
MQWMEIVWLWRAPSDTTTRVQKHSWILFFENHSLIYLLTGPAAVGHSAFWGSTQTFYVVFVAARQICGVSLVLHVLWEWGLLGTLGQAFIGVVTISEGPSKANQPTRSFSLDQQPLSLDRRHSFRWRKPKWHIEDLTSVCVPDRSERLAQTSYIATPIAKKHWRSVYENNPNICNCFYDMHATGQ